MTNDKQRERLVELLEESDTTLKNTKKEHHNGYRANYLLANGVIVPPCKVGDVVWLISNDGQTVFETEVAFVTQDIDGIYIETVRQDIFEEKDFGETVFLTRKEALKALGGVQG